MPLTPRRRQFALLSLFGLVLPPTAPARQPPVRSLDAELAQIRDAQRLPGFAALLLRDGETLAAGAVGLRHLGEAGNALSENDRFAIGSLTKRMTALMIARLVDAGLLSWDLSLAQALPDTPMRDEYRSVTLAQLLRFQGGIAAYERIGPKLTPELFDSSGTPAEREARFVRHLLSLPAVAAPGTVAVYSNASYLLAAHLAVRASGKDVPTLMQEQVFTPLRMLSAGWGRPRRDARQADQPWLHVAGPDSHQPEPDRIRPPEQLFAAAGGAHMSLADLARFAQVELLARRGGLALLKPATAQRWLGLEPGSAAALQQRGLFFGGTPWLSACYALWPAQGLVLAAAVNGGSPDDAACLALIAKVEQDWLR